VLKLQEHFGGYSKQNQNGVFNFFLELNPTYWSEFPSVINALSMTSLICISKWARAKYKSTCKKELCTT